jgi:hypothetical protein
MPKFLDTTGVSYHLTQLINGARERLILISPFLKLNQRLRELLEDQDRMKIDIRVVYGKNELQPEENNWLRSLSSVRTSFCENLHAKCYLNENGAIITSMNLYEFSQVNNNEMGIYVDRNESPELYGEIYREAQRLLRISEEVKVSVERVPPEERKPVVKDKAAVNGPEGEGGFCIRCKAPIALNPKAPYCGKCYKSWARYKNPDYEEAHCHVCGTEAKSTMSRPACYACFKQRRKDLEWAPAGSPESQP